MIDTELIKDMSARLPYGLKCSVTFKDMEGWKTKDMYFAGIYDNGEGFFLDETGGSIFSSNYKPYLRKENSLSEEELEEQNNTAPTFMQDFYNKHHIDYRGLIEKNIAIDENW